MPRQGDEEGERTVHSILRTASLALLAIFMTFSGLLWSGAAGAATPERPAVDAPDIGLTAKSEGAGACQADVGLGFLRYADWSPIFGISRTEGGQVAADMVITGPCVNHTEVRVHIRSFDIWGDAINEVTVDGHSVIRNVSEGETHRATHRGARIALTYRDTPPLQAHLFHLSIEPQQTEPTTIRKGWGARQKCMDVRHGHFQKGTIVQLWECNGTVSQRFTKEREWGNAGRIRSADDRFCVERDGLSKLILADCSDSQYQRFWLGSTSARFTHIYADPKPYTQVCLDEIEDTLMPILNCHFEGTDDWSLEADPPRLRFRCGDVAASTATRRERRRCIDPVRATQRRDGRWQMSWRPVGPRWTYRTRWDGQDWSAWRSRTRVPAPLATGPRHHLVIEGRHAGHRARWTVTVRR